MGYKIVKVFKAMIIVSYASSFAVFTHSNWVNNNDDPEVLGLTSVYEAEKFITQL